jgi:predicted dehydrogenase
LLRFNERSQNRHAQRGDQLFYLGAAREARAASAEPMRFGLIGTGYWARAVHGASAAQHPDVELVGVWGRDQARTEAAASELNTRAYRDLEHLLNDIEALTFAVPPDVQAEIAIRAATAGKHLLLEKPIATTVAEAHRLERAITNANVASIVFFTRRFIPEIQSWMQHLEQLGGWECGRAEVAASILTEGNPFGQSPWRHEKGGLWDVGPHALSVLLPVLGRVTSVVAGRGVRDQVHLVLQHNHSRSSTASLSLMVPDKAIGGSTYVYGEHGREDAPTVKVEPVRAHAAALDALLGQARQTQKGHACDVHFGARVVEVLAAAEQSLDTGCAVNVEAP